METRACQVFLHLADTLHFGQTASRCNLSPSAVSRQLQRLEESVGQMLVERDNRHVRLTRAGHHFLDYARKAVGDWQQLQSDLSASGSKLSGDISVFGSVTASYSLLTQILPVMRESYPGVEIKLRTGDQADGVSRVKNKTEDSAIVARPVEWPSDLAFLPLLQTPLKLIGPKTPSALSRQLDIILSGGHQPEWSDIPVVLAESGLAREQWLEWFDHHQLCANIYAQVAGHEAVVSMVSLGFGIAVVPELVIQHSPIKETIRVLPWVDDLSPFQLGLCARAERLEDPLLDALWQCAAEAYPNH
ncbi:MAG: HTH-type transcriptional activator IlvY [Acidiferrobacterales bacterium]|nr:HTH-type transcriptional activator IlvY [Acidiferrobacterales bacterium]